MTNLAELIDDLAKKAGLSGDNEELKAIIKASTGIAIGSEVETALTTNLFNAQAAKSNAALKSHYFRQAYDAIDQEILKRSDKLQLDGSFVETLKTEQSTNKKLSAFLDKIEELKAAQKDAKKDGDKDTEKLLKAEIEKLNGSINAIKEDHTKAIREKDEHHINYIKDSKILGTFSSQNWSELYSPDMRDSLAKIALDKELNKMGAKVVYDEKGELKLVQAANPEMEYFDSSNKKVIFTELVPQIMATNKFSAVSEKTDPVTPQNTIVGGGKLPVTPQGNNTVANLLNKSLQDQNQI